MTPLNSENYKKLIDAVAEAMQGGVPVDHPLGSGSTSMMAERYVRAAYSGAMVRPSADRYMKAACAKVGIKCTCEHIRLYLGLEDWFVVEGCSVGSPLGRSLFRTEQEAVDAYIADVNATLGRTALTRDDVKEISRPHFRCVEFTIGSQCIGVRRLTPFGTGR